MAPEKLLMKDEQKLAKLIKFSWMGGEWLNFIAYELSKYFSNIGTAIKDSIAQSSDVTRMEASLINKAWKRNGY